MLYFTQEQTLSGLGGWSYVKPKQFNGFGSWLKKAVSNVGKFVQQTDLVSHAASELGVGKTTVGKILVPTASDNINKYQTIVKADMPKPVMVSANATDCAKSEFAKDQRCIEWKKAQDLAAQSQSIIDQQTVALTSTKNKTTLIVGGAVVLAIGLIVVANMGGHKKALNGPPKKSVKRVAKKKAKRTTKKK